MFKEVVLHSLAEVTLVIAQTAGELLDVLVNIRFVNIYGVTAVGAEVTLLTLKLILGTSLGRRWFPPSPSLDCLTLEVNNLTFFSSVNTDCMPDHVVSVE